MHSCNVILLNMPPNMALGDMLHEALQRVILEFFEIAISHYPKCNARELRLKFRMAYVRCIAHYRYKKRDMKESIRELIGLKGW